MNKAFRLLGMLAVVTVNANAASHMIVQAGRAFKPSTIQIGPGDTLDFANQDEFIHQVYVVSGLAYDSAEQPPGSTIHISFPVAGDYEVRCHIHPKMLLTVHVR